MLLSAYEQGIFPWYSEGEPILWHSPEPRFVLEPGDFRVPKSVRKIISRGIYSVTFDREFSAVIAGCKNVERAGQSGTWITDEMESAYTELHRLGYAHSAEVWLSEELLDTLPTPPSVELLGGEEELLLRREGGVLVGGLYGVSLGSIYFGESMFSLRSDASKVGFVTLARTLFDLDYDLLDSQVYTEHLARFGAKEIPREEYLERLKEALRRPALRGPWTEYEPR
ncbi:MAG: leucyl/phenylalanyl-tRNA--protein transferase [Spirochaetaceae bacterium]